MASRPTSRPPGQPLRPSPHFGANYFNGTLVSWYYYKAKSDGWAVNAEAFKKASKDLPAILEIGQFEKIEGLQAVPVKKGDRLPANTNGIIEKKVVEEGKRVTLEGNTLKVTVPSQVKEAKGFKFKEMWPKVEHKLASK